MVGWVVVVEHQVRNVSKTKEDTWGTNSFIRYKVSLNKCSGDSVEQDVVAVVVVVVVGVGMGVGVEEEEVDAPVESVASDEESIETSIASLAKSIVVACVCCCTVTQACNMA